MKREIKFKVFDNVDYMSGSFDLIDFYEGRIQFTNECIVMQFTGLKDINDKEIYEGDILEICNGSINCFPWMQKNSVVVFKNGSFNVPIWDFDSTHWIKVIGNIYENPELLETKKAQSSERKVE